MSASTRATGDMSSIPESGRSSGVGNENPLEYSCLEYPIDRRFCQATAHGVTKGWAQLSNWSCTHSDAMILHIKNPKILKQKIARPNQYSKVTGYKIIVQKAVDYTSRANIRKK